MFKKLLVSGLILGCALGSPVYDVDSIISTKAEARMKVTDEAIAQRDWFMEQIWSHSWKRVYPDGRTEYLDQNEIRDHIRALEFDFHDGYIDPENGCFKGYVYFMAYVGNYPYPVSYSGQCTIDHLTVMSIDQVDNGFGMRMNIGVYYRDDDPEY